MSTAEIESRRRSTIEPELIVGPPGHLELPESDGRIVENFNEHPQGMILSDSLLPVLNRKHPDGRFALGRDSGIYYRWQPDEPPLSGAISPDWYYVPDVPPTLEGEYRRSYVLWRELVAPLIVLEFASGDGSEERDRTPPKGKFWVYERAIRPAYYGIFIVRDGTLEMHEHVGAAFRRMVPNERGHYPVPELGVELGVWHGRVENLEFPWMRWFDADGRLLPSGHEIADQERQRAEVEHRRAEAERQRAEAERQRAERLVAQLRAMGVEPDA
ncbi:MAG: hypothetical protein JWN86_3919 [Planctomycetota bacterium]|nr:hypothetical protein [Planctomycetota bacterium]